MLKYFVSRHFAIFPRRLSNGSWAWLKHYFAVHRYTSGFGEIILTKEELTTVNEHLSKTYCTQLREAEKLLDIKTSYREEV